MATSGGDHRAGRSVSTATLGGPAGLAVPAGLAETGSLRQLALRLQRPVVPPGGCPASGPGLEIAARCRPARGGSFGAGDWYDALPLPGGDLLLVVGDIAGHGLDAVADMSLARNALRGLAAAGAEPAELLGALNRTACLFTEGVTGTVICGRYTSARRELRWARAGHLPPLLVRDGVAAVQPLPEGMLLGVRPETAYQQLWLRLDPGDTVLFYTDGLIERRGASITDALADFAATAVPVGPDLDRHVASMLAGTVCDTGDDACLLAARVR